MRLATIDSPTGPHVAVVVADRVLDLVTASAEVRSGCSGVFAAGLKGLLEAGEHTQEHVTRLVDTVAEDSPSWNDEADVTYRPPIPDPPRIFCIGRNYAEHAYEGHAEVPDSPMIFLKPATALIGHQAPVVIAEATSKVDWEGELGVVIGATGRAIEEADAQRHIAGFVVANDVTARDWQRRTSQFDAGKMFDTFAPTGPHLVTADEIADLDALSVTTTINGVQMQHGVVADMIFPVHYLISYISHAVRLLPGDLILTGTPSGVGYARTPPLFLQDCDVVQIEIPGVGVLTNRCCSENTYRAEHQQW